jgi:hypothetical protein
LSLMKNLVGILVLLAFAFKCHAQAVVPPNVRATHTLDRLRESREFNTADLLYGIPLPEGTTIGDTYLDAHWKTSSILLYENEKLIEGFPIRYDIKADEMEVKSKKGIKVLKGSKIKSFVWVDSVTKAPDFFVNAKDFKNESNVPYSGFFQVLTEGSLPLFKKTEIDIKKADYNIQFNVGSQDDKILKKSEFYALKDNQVIELPSSRKKLVALFGDKSEAMEVFIKENDLSITKEDPLKIIFEHYNSLVNN